MTSLAEHPARFEQSAVLSGCGISEVGRRLGRDPLSLVHQAVQSALADAGLSVADIDGLATAPGAVFGPPVGVTFGGAFDLMELFGIQPAWITGGIETPGHIGPVIDAAMAIHAGLCRHVLCVRGTWEATHTALQREGKIPAPMGSRVYGTMAWQLPFGAFSAGNWIAMQATHHMERYGTTREQLGAIALNARANAAGNPTAVYRDPLTMDDYLSARMITSPFGLYDCDVPCDGAIAVIVSSADTVADLPRAPVRIDAVGTAITERMSWDQGTMEHEPMVQGPAEHLWARTELRHGDVDVAEIYDGFTFNCMSWIEALGFCEVGEGGPFVEGGERIALDGELPLNTGGGQLSGGRLHGFGFLHEAMVQLRGEGGDRQVPGDPEVALVTTGGGFPGGAMLLTTDR